MNKTFSDHRQNHPEGFTSAAAHAYTRTGASRTRALQQAGKRDIIPGEIVWCYECWRSTAFIPIVATLVAGICWAFFMLLYIVFWSRDFDLFQNIVIVFLSVVVAGCVMGLMWMSWLFRRG